MHWLFLFFRLTVNLPKLLYYQFVSSTLNDRWSMMSINGYSITQKMTINTQTEGEFRLRYVDFTNYLATSKVLGPYFKVVYKIRLSIDYVYIISIDTILYVKIMFYFVMVKKYRYISLFFVYSPLNFFLWNILFFSN